MITGSAWPVIGMNQGEILKLYMHNEGSELEHKVSVQALFLFIIAVTLFIGMLSMGVFQGLAGSIFTSKIRSSSLRSLLTFDQEFFDIKNKAQVANSLAHDTE